MAKPILVVSGLNKTFKLSKERETEFLVPNMVCEGCANTIDAVLIHLPGVREVRPKVPQKRVYVRYEPERVKEEQLRDTLQGAGFTAVEA